MCTLVILFYFHIAGGVDYGELNAVAFDVFLTFNDNNRRLSFMVEIFDDELFENVEIFDLELRFDPFLPGPPSGVMLDPDVATVYVLDNEGNNDFERAPHRKVYVRILCLIQCTLISNIPFGSC